MADDDVTEAWVPGAFELPMAAKAFAESGARRRRHLHRLRDPGRHDPLRDGGRASARPGIQQAQLGTGVPIVFGVLTTENLDQALARSEGPGGHNVGEEAAATRSRDGDVAPQDPRRLIEDAREAISGPTAP